MLETEGLWLTLCVEFRIWELEEPPAVSSPAPALDTVPDTPAPTGLPKLSCTEFKGEAIVPTPPALEPLVWFPAAKADAEGLLRMLGDEVDA